MGLEETIAEAIIMAVDELGGNPQNAVDAAMRCDSVEQWIQQETAKLAVAGGAEMIIPGLHAITIPAGITYLMSKLAYISWGIGALKGAYIIETEGHSDLRNILTLWANNTHFNASLIDHLAISTDALTWAMSKDGQKAIPKLLKAKTDETTLNTYRLLQELAEQFAAGDERGYLILEAVIGVDSAQSALVDAKNVVPLNDDEVVFNKPLGRKISTRLAGKLAARLGGRIPARFIVGFIPLAGAIVNAFLNAQTMQSMADSAEKYYDRRLREAHLSQQKA